MTQDNNNRRDLRAIKTLLELFDLYQLDCLEVDGIKISRAQRPQPAPAVIPETPGTITNKKKKPINLNVDQEVSDFFSTEGYRVNGSN